MARTIFFDMDGTIANLYGVDGWLDCIIARDEKPYRDASALLNLNSLARVLNRLQREGNRIAVISWLAKNSTADYDEKVTEAKKGWLKKHLASVRFDEINIVEYGTPKQVFATSENDILFDDEEPNRTAWTGIAYNVNNIIEVLKKI